MARRWAATLRGMSMTALRGRGASFQGGDCPTDTLPKGGFEPCMHNDMAESEGRASLIERATKDFA